MEFMCVLSVGGSLATYNVRQKDEGRYSATLRTSNGNRTDIPAEIELQKKGSEWTGSPSNDEIVRGLANAIEATANFNRDAGPASQDT